ncbi:GIY-YIG nuclease family protein, partial [Mycobacterium tuberculosis]|uniref:GIY-YIG nuclease family protein n=1 Tax=Mycobacterium tuberculosis TaxID=1773 RepID=UPI00147C92D1
ISTFISLKNIKKIPDGIRGVYFLYSDQEVLLYIGKSSNIKTRLIAHIKGITNTKDFHEEIAKIRFIKEECPTMTEILENSQLDLKEVADIKRENIFHRNNDPIQYLSELAKLNNNGFITDDEAFVKDNLWYIVIKPCFEKVKAYSSIDFKFRTTNSISNELSKTDFFSTTVKKINGSGKRVWVINLQDKDIPVSLMNNLISEAVSR